MIDWKVGDRVLWVDRNEVTGDEGEVLNVDDNWVSIKWQDMDAVETYDPYEKVLGPVAQMNWAKGDWVRRGSHGPLGTVQLVDEDLVLVWWDDNPILHHYCPDDPNLVRWPK